MNGIYKERQNNIFMTCMKIVITLYLLYTFWFQYAVMEVSDLLLVLGGSMIVLIVFLFISKGTISVLGKSGIQILILFLIVTIPISIYVTPDYTVTMQAINNMLEYTVTMIAVYFFCSENKQSYLYTLKVISLSTILLCVSLFAKGQLTQTGALAISTLNTNVIASLIFIGIACTLILSEYSSKIFRRLLYLETIAMISAQVMVASRRGFVVCVMFLFAYIFFCVIPVKSAKMNSQKILVWMIMFMFVSIISYFVMTYLNNSTVLGMRLSGKFDAGDMLRHEYAHKAIDIFKQHQITGVGLNGFRHYEGIYSHSLYLELLSCTGVIGTGIMLLYLVKITRSLHRLYKRYEGESQADAIRTRIMFWFSISIFATGIAVVMIYDFYFYIWVALISGYLKLAYKNKAIGGV